MHYRISFKFWWSHEARLVRVFVSNSNLKKQRCFFRATGTYLRVFETRSLKQAKGVLFMFCNYSASFTNGHLLSILNEKFSKNCSLTTRKLRFFLKFFVQPRLKSGLSENFKMSWVVTTHFNYRARSKHFILALWFFYCLNSTMTRYS